MNKFKPWKVVLSSVVLAGAVTALGCTDLNYPSSGGYGGGGYRDPYYGGGYNSGYGSDYDRREDWRREKDLRNQQRDIERERDRVEEERRRLEEEKRRQDSWRPTPPPPPREERCPSGFSPSENKCSREERKRGCQDMRLPGGLGCVKR